VKKIFGDLIDVYLDSQVGISKLFVEKVMAAVLKKHLLELYKNNDFSDAGIGINGSAQQNKSIRSDKILWLDEAANIQLEKSLFTLMHEFILYLNQTCYTGITGFEFHYAMYEKGSFYAKHLDQFKQQSSRAFSMIHYLNEDWQQEDGGELCLHLGDIQQRIAPISGTSVFFKSNEIAHEVLVTQVPRLSITGWLRVD
jgi:SM-20-related protein